MVIKHAKDVAGEAPQMDGVRGVNLQWLINKGDGAINYAMRLFTLEPGGVIPVHTHDDTEHEVFIVEGKGIASDGSKEYAIKENDAIFIPSGDRHSFVNNSTGPLKFICVVPIKEQVK